MKKLLTILIVVLVLSSSLVIAQPLSVSAKGSTLEEGEGKAYATIQAAVDDAVSGDTILVYPGYYEESVLVTTDRLEIIAEGDEVTVSSPDWATAAFTVYADHVTIRGFDELTGYFLGCNAGIEFEGSFNEFTDNVIDPGSCPGVNALVCRDPDGGSNFNRIENNTIVHGDLGIVMTSTSADALNIGNIIRNNTINGIAMTGIAVENGRGFTISGNTIPGTGFGHCISIAADNNIPQGHHRITNNQVWNCKDYGIALWADDQTTFTNNLVTGNQVSFSLHGINMYADPDATLSHNLIRDNTVYHNLEVGIILQAGAEINQILDNLVETNHGMGIIISGDNNKIIKNDVLSNAADGISVDGDNNLVVNNTALGNDVWDLADYGLDNKWLSNEYGTASWE